VTEQISQRELRNDSGRIMRGLDEGRTYIVTRRAEPVGELRPLRRRRFVDSRAVVEIFQEAPKVDWTRFRGDLDTAVDQSVDPRS
jgi:antitoxin (DNA-binding transcriptional repressor) of toxin-antitoxin stability system